jgi:polyisoprenoid-binding protein YceI
VLIIADSVPINIKLGLFLLYLNMKFFLLILVFFASIECEAQGKYMKTTTGKISFISTAPKEIIKANANELSGILNLDNKNFSFKIFMKNFDGFNSPLQKEHFHENYMETNDFPEATFVGKILDPLGNAQKQKVRAKGMLNIHGVSKEILIDINLKQVDNGFYFESKFELELEDFSISIPKLVNQKISKVIKVTVEGILKSGI